MKLLPLRVIAVSQNEENKQRRPGCNYLNSGYTMASWNMFHDMAILALSLIIDSIGGRIVGKQVINSDHPSADIAFFLEGKVPPV